MIAKDRDPAQLGGGEELGHIALVAGIDRAPFHHQRREIGQRLGLAQVGRITPNAASVGDNARHIERNADAPFVGGLDVARGMQAKGRGDGAVVGRHGGSAAGRGDEEQLGWLRFRLDLGWEGHEPEVRRCSLTSRGGRTRAKKDLPRSVAPPPSLKSATMQASSRSAQGLEGLEAHGARM